MLLPWTESSAVLSCRFLALNQAMVQTVAWLEVSTLYEQLAHSFQLIDNAGVRDPLLA